MAESSNPFVGRGSLTDEQLNAPIAESEYTRALLNGGGVRKMDDGEGGRMRINPLTKQATSWSCGHCGTRRTKLKACAACCLVGYCDRTCQKAGWPEHRAFCKQARTSNPGNPEVNKNIMQMWDDLAFVPGYMARLGKAMDESPITGDDVPLFHVIGGSNPFLVNLVEVSVQDRECLKGQDPEFDEDMLLYTRPLDEKEKQRNRRDGTRTAAFLLSRGGKAGFMRGRVSA